MNKIIPIIGAFILSIFQISAQSDEKTTAYALSGGTAHLGNGEKIEDALIIMQNKQILFVGKKGEFDIEKENKLNDSFYAKVIDTEGKHIYPGFIGLNSIAGLNEIDALRPTKDFDEVGSLNPHVRSCIAYNTDSEILPTLLFNGITSVEATPRGGSISGKSCLMRTQAWNWEDAIIVEDAAIHMNWPKQFNQKGWWANPGGIEKNEKYEKKVQDLYDYFKQAKAYSEIENPETQNLRFEAMKPVFQSNTKVFVHVSEAPAMLEVIEFKKAFDIEVVFVGAEASWQIADIIAENNIPVVLNSIHNLPEHRSDAIDQMYKTPAILKDAGVSFALSIAGSWEIRNLPFIAGSAVNYGLDYESAVASITSSAAKIIGAEDIGSIEVGKKAFVIVSTGDALDMKNSIIEYAFIDGKEADLSNRHLFLYEKYKEKYKNKP